jgi:RNA polymerase sigma-70 factor (ECF subfamily)
VQSDRLAEELAQETFVRLWASRASLQNPDAVVGWVYKAATRLAIDELRRGRFELVGLESEIEDRRGAESQTVARLDARALAKTLDDESLEVAILAYVDGMTQPEIAKIVGVSDRTVRRILDRVEQTAKEGGRAR